MHKISVEIPGEPMSYKINVDPGLVDDCASHFDKYSKVALVIDSNLDELYGKRIMKALWDLDVVKFVVPHGEKSKSFDQVQILVDGFAEAGLMRNSCVVCFGGGMIGDLGGFAASIYMRGIDFFQFPTTLLAMVDSSIGGKTGINVDAGKNLVGAFAQPSGILVDPVLLDTLPDSEVQNGVVEMVKHALFADLELIDLLEEDPLSEEAISRAASIKVDIVQEDEKEHGKRKWLNVGHTVGHAIEKLSKFKLAHGQAVVKGIYFESFIAAELGILDNFGSVIDSLDRLGLDYSLPEYDLEEVWEFMLKDKKNIAPHSAVMSFISIPGKHVEVREVTKDEFMTISKKFYE